MKLLALNCPECHQPLTPENDHIIVLCQECSTAVQIDEQGLNPIEIHYAAAAGDQIVAEWQPFWIFTGKVDLLKRDTQGGHKSGGKAATELWGHPRQFYVPAWELSMRTAQSIGSQMVQQQPRFTAGPSPTNPTLLPVVIAAADAIKLLEFIILAIEARRDDWLKDLQFRLDVESPSLWALPGNYADLMIRNS